MRKRIAIGFILLLLLGMTACRADVPAVTTNPPGSEGPSRPVMTEPPKLTVSFGKGDSFEADTLTYTWTYDTGDGRMSGTCADSPHPLDLQEHLAPMETTVSAVELLFEVPPQSFHARCWNDTNWGDMNARDKSVSLDGNRMELEEGGCIYEVTATWSGENLAAEGTVHYAFYVIKHSVQYAHEHKFAAASQTVAAPVSGYCGNMVTKILMEGAEYAFMDSDSVDLTDLLINLKYDPAQVCKCLPDFYVETEFGKTYGVSLSGYARCEDGQAALTAEQVETIQRILENQIDS